MTLDRPWTIVRGDGPLVAVSLHSGHAVRPDVAALMVASEEERLREEDPLTDRWAAVAPNRVTVRSSRFEADFNRPREQAIYRTLAESWGIHVWQGELPERIVEDSLARYDAFYGEVTELLEDLRARHRRFVVLDIHSYCHRRGGAGAPADDPRANPELNLGTESIDRDLWGALVDRFREDLRSFDGSDRRFDVRENVRWKGGYFPRWVNREYAGEACAITVEVRKDYIDEWSGEIDSDEVERVGAALRSAVPGLLEELAAVEGDRR